MTQRQFCQFGRDVGLAGKAPLVNPSDLPLIFIRANQDKKQAGGAILTAPPAPEDDLADVSERSVGVDTPAKAKPRDDNEDEMVFIEFAEAVIR